MSSTSGGRNGYVPSRTDHGHRAEVLEPKARKTIGLGPATFAASSRSQQPSYSCSIAVLSAVSTAVSTAVSPEPDEPSSLGPQPTARATIDIAGARFMDPS